MQEGDGMSHKRKRMERDSNATNKLGRKKQTTGIACTQEDCTKQITTKTTVYVEVILAHDTKATSLIWCTIGHFKDPNNHEKQQQQITNAIKDITTLLIAITKLRIAQQIFGQMIQQLYRKSLPWFLVRKRLLLPLLLPLLMTTMTFLAKKSSSGAFNATKGMAPRILLS